MTSQRQCKQCQLEQPDKGWYEGPILKEKELGHFQGKTSSFKLIHKIKSCSATHVERGGFRWHM